MFGRRNLTIKQCYSDEEKKRIKFVQEKPNVWRVVYADEPIISDASSR